MVKGKATKRFGDLYEPIKPRANVRLRAIDLLGVDLEVLAADKQMGNYGPYLQIYARRLDTGEQITFACGAGSVMKKVSDALAGGFLPMIGKLVEVDRRLDIV